MARSLPVENLLPQNVGSIINYLQQFTEVAHWGAPSCTQPQPATDNGVRDGRSNWLVALPTPELHVLHSAMRALKLLCKIMYCPCIDNFYCVLIVLFGKV